MSLSSSADDIVVTGIGATTPLGGTAPETWQAMLDGKVGVKNIDVCGVDNITFETDYPHTDSTWPETRQVAEKLMEGVPDDVVYKLMRGNAIRMLQLDPD